MKFIWYFTAIDQSARYSTFFTVSCEKSGIAHWLVRANQSARYSTFFTANCEKSGIASWLVRVECANCCHRIVEMMRTGFRKLCFFSYSQQRTSHDFENNRKTMLTEVTTQLGSESASALCTKIVSPLLSWLAGSSKKPLLIVEVSLKIRYFDFNERSYSINVW